MRFSASRRLHSSRVIVVLVVVDQAKVLEDLVQLRVGFHQLPDDGIDGSRSSAGSDRHSHIRSSW
jgi:hypothetical protein